MAESVKAPGARRASQRTGGTTGEARAALLAATIDLLASRGPDGFSSHDVAKAAGVSYGLIHYYFGSRTELLRQAISEETQRYSAATPSLDDPGWVPFLLTAPLPDATWRGLVQMALNWDRYGELIEDFPIMRRRLEVLTELHGDEIDEVHRKAALIASGCLQMGWLIGSSWYLAAAGGDDEVRDATLAFIVEVEQRMLDLARERSARAVS